MVRLSPQERKHVHDVAKHSETNGNIYNCNYKIYPKQQHVAEIDDGKVLAAMQLASLIYCNEYARFALDFFNDLRSKLQTYYPVNHVIPLIKGSTALALYFKDDEMLSKQFPFSDIDIIIKINPKLPNFKYIRNHVKVLVGQTMAQHKKNLDKLLFKSYHSQGKYDNYINPTVFKEKHISTFKDIDIVSPFMDDTIRNSCSYTSFYLTNSSVMKDKVVKIDEQHFEHAEKIPLDRTPIFCSINDTIHNVTNGKTTKFDLFRMKWNMIDCESGSKIAVDFIDCIIPDIEDSELSNFMLESTMYIQRFGYTVYIPTLETLAQDLWNMIYVYDCPDSKKNMRLIKLETLEKYLSQ